MRERRRRGRPTRSSRAGRRRRASRPRCRSASRPRCGPRPARGPGRTRRARDQVAIAAAQQHDESHHRRPEAGREPARQDGEHREQRLLRASTTPPAAAGRSSRRSRRSPARARAPATRSGGAGRPRARDRRRPAARARRRNSQLEQRQPAPGRRRHRRATHWRGRAARPASASVGVPTAIKGSGRCSSMSRSMPRCRGAGARAAPVGLSLSVALRLDDEPPAATHFVRVHDQRLAHPVRHRKVGLDVRAPGGSRASAGPSKSMLNFTTSSGRAWKPRPRRDCATHAVCGRRSVLLQREQPIRERQRRAGLRRLRRHPVGDDVVVRLVRRRNLHQLDAARTPASTSARPTGWAAGRSAPRDPRSWRTRDRAASGRSRALSGSVNEVVSSRFGLTSGRQIHSPLADATDSPSES